MKQKKSNDVTLQLIYKELTGFITKQETFNSEVREFMTKQEEFNAEVREFMVKTDKRLDVLETKVDAIMECPTIKRELELL